MNRKSGIEQLHKAHWDVIIIGGGATGLGIALDCQTRGYKTLLLEAKDFTQGTSSRSTKLLHGGVRYLASGDLALVYEALRERGHLIANAPHLCLAQSFIIPSSNLFDTLFYGIGLKIYALMAGKLNLHKTEILSHNKAKARLKGIQDHKLKYGICYYDGQFDDARLGISLAQSATKAGAVLLNYMPIQELLYDQEGKICGVGVTDELSLQKYCCYAPCIINATGVFTHSINQLDSSTKENAITPSQGIHLVLSQKFLPSCDALMIPKTTDGRVLFAIPWHNKLIVGTTDTPIKEISYNPLPLEEEIDFLLQSLGEYLVQKPTRKDVLSCFVGLRPLVSSNPNQSTKNLSRSHKISISSSHLVHINGGKWTTYRHMAEQTIDACIKAGLLPNKPCCTKYLKLHGFCTDPIPPYLKVYGSDAKAIQALQQSNPKLATKIHPDYDFTYAQVLWALEHEMAQNIEDILSRRIRLLFLDAQAAFECAKGVGEFLGEYFSWDYQRCSQEIETFQNLAKMHMIKKE